ncbi:MAG TPA: sulfatase-like hydrolase/transferase, partial [Spirochaetia bacterium]|nr:sulfatase-like hydrolase/transferase [Spirochaetia bacterium]
MPDQLRKTNFILLMCDDLGYGDTGFNGNREIKTSHLDAMAESGVRFTRFYAGGPVCSPTRGTCLTGRHYSRYGITHANVGHLPLQEITIQQILKSSGYTTGHFGKWHLSTMSRKYSAKPGRQPELNYAPPWEHNFDQSFSTEFAVPTWNPSADVTAPFHDASLRERPPGERWKSPYFEGGVEVTDELKGDDSKIIMNRTLPFIEQAAKNDRPFLAVIWFHAPHSPVVAGPEYLRLYEDQELGRRHYYGCITAMDEQVGRLRAALRRLGVAENTMLCFCSDNGPEGMSEGLDSNINCGSTKGFRGRKRS